MLKEYKKFCCAFYKFQQKIGNADIATFSTFMFTIFLFELILFAADSLVYLLFKTPYYLQSRNAFIIAAIFCIPNYLLVFRKKRFLEYENRTMTNFQLLAIVVLTFGISLGLILYTGPRNLPRYKTSGLKYSHFNMANHNPNIAFNFG